MAIDFAKGIATQVVNTGLRKVAGNLPGLLGINKGKTGINSSDTAPLNERGKASPNLFQFPLDVAGDPGIGNHGHYIIFFVNEQQGSELRFTDRVKDGKLTLAKEKRKRNILEKIKDEKGNAVNNTQDQLVNTGTNSVGKDTTVGLKNAKGEKTEDEKIAEIVDKAQYVKVKRPPTKRLDTAIAMYMPAQVQVTYGTKYNDTEISPFAAAAGEAITNAMGGMGLSDNYNQVVGKISEGLKKKGVLMGLSVLDGIGISGAREALEIASGEIIADRMELAFKGVDRRSFQYTFKMIPRNSREADEIRKIVFAFKSNMLPELIGGKDRDTMRVPNTFNIQYMYQGKENDFIHRVSECFLENVQVSYGGDRYKTFEPHDDSGAPPVETSITLAFKEIEIMTKERIFEGY